MSFPDPVPPIADPFKHQVAQTFGQAASTYHVQAALQKDCAADLIAQLQTYRDQLPEGTILELGCGTGFVTQELINHFSDRPLHISDLSAEMLAFCQANVDVPVTGSPSITFTLLDGEAVVTNLSYAAIVSGFVVQWFVDPVLSLQKLVQRLVPGGVLLASFPTHQSFPEWRQRCRDLGLPYTANPLPDPARLCAALASSTVTCAWYEYDRTTTYCNALTFFKSLKQIGAGVQRSPQPLSSGQLTQLIRAWNDPSGRIQVQYRIAVLTIQRL